MKRFVVLLAGVFALAAAWIPTAALANTITYTESGVGTGSLGETSFTDAPFTITLVADPAHVVTGPGGVLANPSGTATLSINGSPVATFTEQLAAFDAQADQTAGLGSVPQMISVLGTTDPVFGTYGLTTSIGPIANTSSFNVGASFATDQGAFVLNSVGNATFTALATPEPASLAMWALAAVALAGWKLRRQRV